MSPTVTLATAKRVLRQLRRDPRTLALLLVVPLVLMALMRWIFPGPVFNRIGVPLVGIYPLVLMFLVTSVTMLRERVTGTLERLMTMPISRLDLLLGYGLAFGLLACIQAAAVSFFTFGLLGLNTEGPILGVVALAILIAILGTALGLLVSAFARSEFQAIQFMPALILPQVFLCGLMAPRDTMARPLELLSYALPLTYSYEALRKLAAGNGFDGALALDVTIVAASALLALSLGAATLRRRTP